MTARGVARSIKNYAKGFSDAQIKVREATSNDPWGPSGTLMNEIAQLTYNEHDFVEIMDMIDRRLNDKGKNWRHVFKALLLLDYCLHVGSENVVLYAKENIYVVKTLKEFQHVDDNGRDVGANVRQKAKDITALLNDDARLKEERRSRQHMRERMAGVGDYMNETLYGRGGPPDGSVYERPGYLDEDRDLQRAMEESRRMARDEARNREQSDEDLARAIELSEQEAREQERRKREKLERENAKNLFGNGDTSTQTTSFNPFPANQAFDSSHNPYTNQQQFPQMTGMTNMSFQDPIASQQRTGFGNGFSNPYQQTGSLNPSPWGAFGNNIQAQMTGIPQQTQFTGLAPFQTNPSMGFSTTQQQQQQPQFTGATNFQTSIATGIQSNNPFGHFGTSQAQTLQPQQTGFASIPLSMRQTGFTSTPINTQQTSSAHTATSSFAPSAQTATSTTPVSVSKTTTGSTRPVDPRYAKLDALLASREDGTDTFGNTGNLRIPVGTGFANSIKPEYTGVQRSNSTGNLVDVSSNNNNTSSSFTKSFGDQNSRNPFAPGNNSSNSAGNTPMVQPQFPQATGMAPLQSQVTGMAPMQAQMTGMQPQMTGFGTFGQQPQHQQQQQQPSLF